MVKDEVPDILGDQLGGSMILGSSSPESVRIAQPEFAASSPWHR